MKTVDFRLEAFRNCIPKADLCVPAVSKWSVGMHVHHCCLAMIGICQALSASPPPPPRSRFSLIPALVFLSGRIPRGRGRSPDVVVPTQDVSPAELLALLEESERKLNDVQQLDAGTWFKHFVFGVLDRDKTIRFIRIHNGHHLRIISDIMAAQTSDARR